MAHYDREIVDMLKISAQLIEAIQNASLGKDESISIDHSRLWINIPLKIMHARTHGYHRIFILLFLQP